MTEPRHARLEDVVLDDLFPEVDLALRRGRHVDRDDPEWYAFITDAQDHLELFYRRYGCELVHRSEGYFYLLPTNDLLGRRHLSAIDMLIGQGLTLLYLDPVTVQNGGLITREQLLGHLAGVMGTDALVYAMNPKRKKHDPRVAEETARNKVIESVRRLASLGFAEMVDDKNIRLRPSLMRFAEPVRGSAAPEAALERLVAAGEIVLTEPNAEREDDADADDDDASSEVATDANESAAEVTEPAAEATGPAVETTAPSVEPMAPEPEVPEPEAPEPEAPAEPVVEHTDGARDDELPSENGDEPSFDDLFHSDFFSSRDEADDGEGEDDR